MRRWGYVDVMMIVIMRTIMSKISRLALLSKAKIAKFNTPHQDLSIGFICVPGSSPDFFLFWLNHISSPTPVVFQARQMHDDPSEQYTDTCSIVHLYRIQLERTVGLFLSPTFILRSVWFVDVWSGRHPVLNLTSELCVVDVMIHWWWKRNEGRTCVRLARGEDKNLNYCLNYYFAADSSATLCDQHHFQTTFIPPFNIDFSAFISWSIKETNKDLVSGAILVINPWT